MAIWIVVEEQRDRERLQRFGIEAIHVDEYLTGGKHWLQKRGLQILNLCRSSKYLSVGYYTSLLAEARGHRVLPSVRSLLDLSSRTVISLREDVLNQAFARLHGLEEGQDQYRCNLYFGRTREPALQELARQIFDVFPIPLLHVRFRRLAEGGWSVHGVRALALSAIPKEEVAVFREALEAWQQQRKRTRNKSGTARFDLAILCNAKDKLPPSDEVALKKFERAGRALGMRVERIDRRDLGRLAEYDALFIRETTRINHYTYRFAKKAEREGMVVMDDPTSILRCTNKVYLAELLRANRVPTPTSVIAGPNDLDGLQQALGYPMVLKIPDGSFSLGVELAKDRSQLECIAAELFTKSELILGQEFLYTEFDWRIGILAGRPLYACQYFMSKRNWKIVEHQADGGVRHGRWKTYPVEQAPPDIVATALRAASLIGDGLYGVDLKQTAKGPVVIEVNDNPSIDSGVEDQVLKDQLYREIMGEFLRRLEIRTLSGVALTN